MTVDEILALYLARCKAQERAVATMREIMEATRRPA